ncbi:MAG: hypothetical protein WD077_03990 [Bacteroidia bacterium]
MKSRTLRILGYAFFLIGGFMLIPSTLSVFNTTSVVYGAPVLMTIMLIISLLLALAGIGLMIKTRHLAP